MFILLHFKMSRAINHEGAGMESEIKMLGQGYVTKIKHGGEGFLKKYGHSGYPQKIMGDG